MQVHPIAALFPMMTDDELSELADDILSNGLIHPLVIDADGVLIDGRNRLRACEIAGVEPTYQQLNGHDAAAFIVSANLERRNLSKGQQAMALAMIYPEPSKGGRGKKNHLETKGFSAARLSQARSVLRHSRALAEDVMMGRKVFDGALAIVQAEQERSQSAEAQLAELHRHASDLAELVAEERLTLAEAYATLKKREADTAAAEANKRETMLRLSESAWHATTAWASGEFVAELSQRFSDDEFRKQWLARVRLDATRLDEIQSGAAALARFCALAVEDHSNV